VRPPYLEEVLQEVLLVLVLESAEERVALVDRYRPLDRSMPQVPTTRRVAASAVCAVGDHKLSGGAEEDAPHLHKKL